MKVNPFKTHETRFGALGLPEARQRERELDASLALALKSLRERIYQIPPTFKVLPFIPLSTRFEV